MKIIKLILIILFLVISSGSITANIAPQECNSSVVVSPKFGIITTDSNGKQSFVEITEVPNVEGQEFGWIAHVDSVSAVRFKETLQLPVAPTTWGETTTGLTISEDGLTATFQKKAIPRDGIISNFWMVAKGDPSGNYDLWVTLEDKLPIHFSFTLVGPGR